MDHHSVNHRLIHSRTMLDLQITWILHWKTICQLKKCVRFWNQQFVSSPAGSTTEYSGKKRKVRNVPNLSLYELSITLKVGCKEHLGKTRTYIVLPNAKDRDWGNPVSKVITISFFSSFFFFFFLIYINNLTCIRRWSDKKLEQTLN